MQELLDPLARWTGLPQMWIAAILAVAGIFFLRWALRNPWGFLRVAIVLSLLSAAAYAAFLLTESGSSGKKAMILEEEE